MSFTITGLLRSQEVSLRWEEGRILPVDDHSRVAALQVERLTEVLEGEPVGPPGGPVTENAHLKDPLSAVFIIRQVLEQITGESGDLPEPQEIPEGAIP